MVSFNPDAIANQGSNQTVGVDALAQLPGIVDLPSIGPSIGTDSSVSQRHEVNPAMATKLLQDIQSMVSVWQAQLRQIVHSMRTLQSQGPMVDGWLESSAEVATATAADASLFRHGDTDALMRYADALDQSSTALQASASPPPVSQTVEKASTHYRLCRLDSQGQMQCHPCPPEQLGVVSMAIARYQKYKHQLLQKQAVERKLQRTVDHLTGVRADLQGE
ncbi:MAG: hypothetical protein AAFN40_18130 [Cyanobacteria bacterium J06560_6]